jgi:hypothetical protein
MLQPTYLAILMDHVVDILCRLTDSKASSKMEETSTLNPS